MGGKMVLWLELDKQAKRVKRRLEVSEQVRKWKVREGEVEIDTTQGREEEEKVVD